MTTEFIPEQKLEKLKWQWRSHSITYTVQGLGQPLVLIHGFGACLGHWRKNIPVLASAGYRVFALDLLGFGESDKPTLDYSLELWQELIRDFYHAHIQEPTIFIGNSIGGLLTLMLMSEHPEMTKGGVIINAAGGLNHRPDELSFPLGVIMGLFTKVVSSSVTGEFVFQRVRAKHRIRETLYQVYRDRAAVTDELVDMLYQPSCDPGAQKVFASVLTAPPGPKPSSLLPQIQQPLLVLWGEADPWTPIQGAKIYQQRAETQMNTEFYAIANAGHCPHDENPTIVNELILKWLEKFR
ncbi:alpha/beta fold hydrolase [Gloeocapsa sp. PCC 73106]|uniref:alpha/beta fold hydrolase n=1 Tax=Gloeocapsa sp. PCC 73106 TaxID=102232 RepID=UPI0002AB9D09|nr:alpha/beta fold hydrolase [Gloeocapsa sp. PCC 73106]ELR97123.1 putative hydrolase or acyltransferase of alpha/beta superfamily [Gloeocapsa sp. PCC 73106]